MVARALVENDVNQGARLLAALDEAGIPVEAAYWMLSPEWGDWWLVLATPLLDKGDSRTVDLRIIDVRRSLEDTDYLMDKLGIVGMNDRWVRALRERLPRGLPKPGYWLGGFWSRDANLSVEDSYVYRLAPRVERSKNGTASKRQTSRNDAATSQRTRAVSDT